MEVAQQAPPKPLWRLLDWRGFVSFGAFAWALVWAGVNSNALIFETDPRTWRDWIHVIRTAGPMLVLLALPTRLVLATPGTSKPTSTPALKLWFAYGVVGLASTVASPDYIWRTAYWALCYLGVITGSLVFISVDHDRLRAARTLNHLTWIFTLVILLGLTFTSARYLIGRSTGYGVFNLVGDVQGMKMSRSSGFARFAAIIGLTAFAALWHPRTQVRILAVPFVGFASYLVWFLQSRGAMLAYAAALVLVFLLQGGRWRRIGLASAVLLIGITVVSEDPFFLDAITRVEEHLRRGSTDSLMTMTGRTHVWDRTWPFIFESPIIGWGFQADRILLHEHVHSTYLYALLTAGFLGAGAFTLGIVWCWWSCFMLWRAGNIHQSEYRTCFVQCAALLLFFSARSIPEVSGSMYGVDQMIMVPVLLFLGLARAEPRLSARPRRAGAHGR